MLNKITAYKFQIIFLVIGLVIGLASSNYKGGFGLECSFYEYLNPHLACRDKPIISKAAYLNFEKDLYKYIESEKQTGKVMDVGVYFRDLENGPTFGLNSSELFISSSLIKLPTVMTIFRLAEQDPKILQNKILYKEEIPSDNQDFAPSKKLEVGHSYTVEELINRSLEYSDNAANELLVYELFRLSPGENLIYNTFRDLGLSVPGDVTKGDLSTKSYSSLLRLLYNASFLSKENSEKILEALDRATFKQGLEVGVPHGIRVASKFGERELEYVSADGKPINQINELHDCGIVYFPNNPYLLCVMTKGDDFNNLSKVIGNISKMVYEEIDSRRLE